ncbi:MAG: hypothetical protein DCC88_00780 [Spirobacillus cienkowskii]|jgi:hypothetical protein|uniref:Peptidase M12A domain-containing protein n=1 Tax=Spirobacillus cienkowskii TaxID=495820 RepID=A0A369KUI6_9BACT|nr:MAG: hypothetical protein DCC88_00780 [Spirobacillus cienkowskii]
MKVKFRVLLVAFLGFQTISIAKSAEMNKNVMKNFYLNIFENDMLLPPVSGKDSLSAPVPQTALWPDGRVYYKFEPEHYLPEEKKVIRESMKYLESIARVKFVEGAGPDNYFIRVVKHDGSGKEYWCSAHVGKLKVSNDWKQILTLGSKCIDKSIILHELLHVLGMHHEQTRHDRDNNIKLLNENFSGGKLHENHNYTRYEDVGSSRFTSYDFDSIMHYHGFSGSNNNLPVLLPTRCYNSYKANPKAYEFYNVQNLQGCDELKKISVWKNDLSEGDKMSLAKMYGPAKFVLPNGHQEVLNACIKENKQSPWLVSVDENTMVHTYYSYKPRDSESCSLTYFMYVKSPEGNWTKTETEEGIIYKQNL